SSKNQTTSAAPSANATPVQTPRSSMQGARPKDQSKLTSAQALELALSRTPASAQSYIPAI
ncbi:hypothetical protein BG004_008284, partial [Podila humilis]